VPYSPGRQTDLSNSRLVSQWAIVSDFTNLCLLRPRHDDAMSSKTGMGLREKPLESNGMHCGFEGV
jgi:hypothetical protein